MLTTEQKLLSILAHGGVFFAAPIVIPLLIMLISKDDFVKTQAKEALIFHIGLVLGCIISGILVIVLVGFVGLIVLGIAAVILPIVAIVNILSGKDFSYPLTGRWARNF